MLTATASPPAAAPPNPLHSSRQMAELIGCPADELYVRSKQLAVSRYDAVIEKLKKEGEKS